MPASLEIRPNAAESRQGTRLDCWKEIAAYLGRGERTVKRWETERGLPIRRLPGGGRSSVYAFSTELDEWLKSSNTEVCEAGEQGQTGSSLDGPDPSEAGAHPTLTQVIVSSSADGQERREAPRFRWLRERSWVLLSAVLLVVSLTVAGWKLASVPGFSGEVLSLRGDGQLVKQASSSALPALTKEKKLARDFYLKGRYEWNQRTPESLDQALDDFTQAVVHDPGYAEGYVGLADTYNLLREYSRMSQSEALSRAAAAARKAIELDSSLADGHRALAFAEMYGSLDFADAEKEFRRAIELNPNDAVVHRWYANAIAVPGRFEESLRQIDKAQELDPTSPSTLADKGIMLFDAGRKQEGIELLEQVERSAPEFQSPHKYLMRIAFAMENYPDYLSEGRTSAALSGDEVLKEEIVQAKAGYTRAGSDGLLQALYAKQREDYAAGKILATVFAQTCVQLGNKQQAIQLLETGYTRHDGYLVATALSDPILVKLKGEPGYQAFVKKLNFPAKAEPAGTGRAWALFH